MKTMCVLGYHDKGFAATYALRHIMYGYYTDLASVKF